MSQEENIYNNSDVKHQFEEGEVVRAEDDNSEGSLEEVFADVPKNTALKLPVGRQLVLLAALILGVFSIGAIPFFTEHLDILRSSQTASPSVPEIGGDSLVSESENSFENLSLAAKSAIVVDLNTGEVLYQKAPDQKLPLASITKLMTALLASELSEDGAVVSISDSAVSQSGDSGLKEGDRFSLNNLIDFILPTSSNDGAFALAASAGSALNPDAPAEAFVEAMNIRARELGLSNTTFRNPTGLDITEDEAGAYGTARDVAKLLQYIVENEPGLLEETTKSDAAYSDLSGVLHQSSNTNPVVDAIPGLIGSKTGYTTLSGGNLAIAWNVGVSHPVVAVVLSSSHSGRFTDVLHLVEATQTHFSALSSDN